MARKGPITKDTSTLALGLAQIRVGPSASNIAKEVAQLVAGDSIGALVNTKFTGNTEFFKHESGFPLLEDYSIPIREGAMLECAFEEITPYNLALANGIDASAGGYTEAHSGEIALGGKTAPAYVRMEAVYTFPNGINYMTIIFPRCQVTSSAELDLQSESAAASPITFEAKNTSSDATGGNAVWDDKPLGAIIFT